jgi:SAM-dependent methyltransferase
MVTQLKNLAKKSKTLVIANNIYDNWRTRRRFQRGRIESDYGSTHGNLRFSVGESVGYVERTFQDYLTYSGLPREAFRGRRILELGVGDSYGVALLFLAHGASQVFCIDKFYSERDAAHERNIYLALREKLGGEERARFDDAVRLDEGIELNPEKLKAVYGTGAEDADRIPDIGTFDFIISRGVLQSVHETDAAFAAMDRLLAPGGVMMHKMDLRDLGTFINYGMHPLTHLTVPAPLYRMMVADTAKSNRRLSDYYRRKVDEYGYDAKIFVTILAGQAGELEPHKERPQLGVDYTEETVELVRRIRPKLSAEFRDLSDEDLMVSGIFMVARKPSGAAA